MDRNAFNGKPSNANLYLVVTSAVATKVAIQVKDSAGNDQEGVFSISFNHCNDVNGAATAAQVATAAFTADTSSGQMNEIVTKKLGTITTEADGSCTIVGTSAEFLNVIGFNGEANIVTISS